MKSTVRLALRAALAGCALALPMAAMAQAPAAVPAAAPPPAPLAIANPSYDTLLLEIAVNKPAALVWAKVGKYCDIQEWFGMKCEITAGKAGELGAVRTLNGVTIEPLVAKTDLSYTYTQPVRQGVPYNLYHGTLEAKPVTATTSKLVYSLIWDASMFDAAGREAAKAGRATRFGAGLQKMKEIAEAN